MIYDCFSFFNELDVLELRLKTLYDYVDYFVLSESNYTHTGIRKPLYFKENESRYAPFAKKIIHVVSPDPENPGQARSDINYRWKLENIQRNATVNAIANRIHEDDILVISDLDEIPDPMAISSAKATSHPFRLRQKLYYYFLNYRCCTTPFWDAGSVLIPVKAFLNPDTYRSARQNQALSPSANIGPTATKVRFLSAIPIIKNGGWHFSYIGGLESVLKKLNSTADGSQAKIDANYVRKCIESGNDPYGRGEWYFAETIDNTFPTAAKEYPLLIFNASHEYLRDVRVRRIIAYLKGYLRPLLWRLIPHAIATRLSHMANNAFNRVK